RFFAESQLPCACQSEISCARHNSVHAALPGKGRINVMRTLRRFSPTVFVLVAFAGTASAQITIANVFNAASRVVNGSLAQGALIAVQGRGVGTSDIELATFPLPTTAGLGGVTIQIHSGGQFFDGLMVYTKPNEVGAILPSAVPVGP